MTVVYKSTDHPPGGDGTTARPLRTSIICKLFGHLTPSLSEGGPCPRRGCDHVVPPIVWDRGVPMPPVKPPREADHEQKLLIQSDKVIDRHEQTIEELTADTAHLVELLRWCYFNHMQGDDDETVRKIKAIIGAP